LLNASSPTIVVRSAAPLARLAPIARKIFQDLAPDVPVKFSRFEDDMGAWLAERRFLLLLVMLFGTAALTLGAIGIYGVVAFSVVRRTQEIGIRVAMGARRSHVLGLVIGEGARIAAIGIVIGVGVSLAVTRLIASLLFGVSATDPVMYAGVAILLVTVSLIASYIPALRAMRTDPICALRCN
jgi:ABC-type antimicrobial peptide transport system permease subunit